MCVCHTKAPGSVEFDIPPLGVIYPGEDHIFLVSDKGVPSISLRGIVSAAERERVKARERERERERERR